MKKKNLTVKCKMLLQSVINVSMATIMKNLPLWMFLCVYFKYFHWSTFWCLFNIRNVTNFFNNWTNYFFTAISRDYLQNSYSDISRELDDKCVRCTCNIETKSRYIHIIYRVRVRVSERNLVVVGSIPT